MGVTSKGNLLSLELVEHGVGGEEAQYSVRSERAHAQYELAEALRGERLARTPHRVLLRPSRVTTHHPYPHLTAHLTHSLMLRSTYNTIKVYIITSFMNNTSRCKLFTIKTSMKKS